MNDNNRNLPVCQAKENAIDTNQAYPSTPPCEDMYCKCKEEKDIDPEDVTETKTPNEEGTIEAVDKNDMTIGEKANDMDVPGSEPDGVDVSLGNEDEENSYYSIGGDGHTNLEEDHGEG